MTALASDFLSQSNRKTMAYGNSFRLRVSGPESSGFRESRFCPVVYFFDVFGSGRSSVYAGQTFRYLNRHVHHGRCRPSGGGPGRSPPWWSRSVPGRFPYRTRDGGPCGAGGGTAGGVTRTGRVVLVGRLWVRQAMVLRSGNVPFRYRYGPHGTHSAGPGRPPDRRVRIRPGCRGFL